MRTPEQPSPDAEGPGVSGSDITEADRQLALADLRRHLGAQRLDSGDYADRVAAVRAATTRDELDVLFFDLPGHLVSDPVVGTVAVRAALDDAAHGAHTGHGGHGGHGARDEHRAGAHGGAVGGRSADRPGGAADGVGAGAAPRPGTGPGAGAGSGTGGREVAQRGGRGTRYAVIGAGVLLVAVVLVLLVVLATR